jgi:hypothetical protein
MKTKIIKPTGEEVLVVPKNKSEFTYHELKKIVGVNIGMIPLDEQNLIIYNEEGLALCKFYNETASILFNNSRYRKFSMKSAIYGSVLICKIKEINKVY